MAKIKGLPLQDSAGDEMLGAVCTVDRNNPQTNQRIHSEYGTATEQMHSTDVTIDMPEQETAPRNKWLKVDNKCSVVSSHKFVYPLLYQILNIQNDKYQFS